MGLNFRKELTLGEFQVGNFAAGFVPFLPDPPPQIFPSPSNQPATTRLQVMYSTPLSFLSFSP